MYVQEAGVYGRGEGVRSSREAVDGWWRPQIRWCCAAGNTKSGAEGASLRLGLERIEAERRAAGLQPRGEESCTGARLCMVYRREEI